MKLFVSTIKILLSYIYILPLAVQFVQGYYPVIACCGVLDGEKIDFSSTLADAKWF